MEVLLTVAQTTFPPNLRLKHDASTRPSANLARSGADLRATGLLVALFSVIGPRDPFTWKRFSRELLTAGRSGIRRPWEPVNLPKPTGSWRGGYVADGA